MSYMYILLKTTMINVYCDCLFFIFTYFLKYNYASELVLDHLQLNIFASLSVETIRTRYLIKFIAKVFQSIIRIMSRCSTCNENWVPRDF